MLARATTARRTLATWMRQVRTLAMLNAGVGGLLAASDLNGFPVHHRRHASIV